jgi:hypothetical protein
MIRKLLIATALVAVGSGAGLASLAAADRPTKEPAPAEDVSGQFCDDFSVLIHLVENKGFVLTFSDGRVFGAGHLRIRLTNLESGKSIVVNASGPIFFSADGATVTLKGATLLFGEPGFFGPDSDARLTLGVGRTVIDLATGAILSEVGHSTDLCPILADP